MKLFPSLFLSLFLAAAGMAQADETTKAAKVEEYLRVSHTEELMKQSIAISLEQVKSGILQRILNVQLPEEQTKLLREFQEKAETLMLKALAWEDLKPAYIKLFSDTYTEQQLDDLIAFFRSPTGQAMIAKTPELMAKASGIVQQRLTSSQVELQKMMTDFTDRLRSVAVPPEPK